MADVKVLVGMVACSNIHNVIKGSSFKVVGRIFVFLTKYHGQIGTIIRYFGEYALPTPLASFENRLILESGYMDWEVVVYQLKRYISGSLYRDARNVLFWLHTTNYTTKYFV